MEQSNKKFWAFIVGSLLATAYIWLIELGINAAVPSSFHGETNFIVSYYPTLVTGMAASVLTIVAVTLMPVLVNTKVSDQLFWLIVPTLSFLTFSLISVNVLFMPLLAAAFPTLLIIVLTYFIEKRDMYMPERLKVW